MILLVSAIFIGKKTAVTSDTSLIRYRAASLMQSIYLQFNLYKILLFYEKRDSKTILFI